MMNCKCSGRPDVDEARDEYEMFGIPEALARVTSLAELEEYEERARRSTPKDSFGPERSSEAHSWQEQFRDNRPNQPSWRNQNHADCC